MSDEEVIVGLDLAHQHKEFIAVMNVSLSVSNTAVGQKWRVNNG